MNKRYNTLGYMIMQILANYSSREFPMSYGQIKSKLYEIYKVSPILNTIAYTVKDLNESAHANIQDVGGRRGLWLIEDISDAHVEALLAPIITADYISENSTEQFEKILSLLNKKIPSTK